MKYNKIKTLKLEERNNTVSLKDNDTLSANKGKYDLFVVHYYHQHFGGNPSSSLLNLKCTFNLQNYSVR